MSLGLLLVAFLVGFFIYRLTRNYAPDVHYNPNGNLKQIFSGRKLANYKPTPWLFNRHIHSIYGLRFRPVPKRIPRRDLHFYKDGGCGYFDWFEASYTSETAPIMIILHTLGGGSREPCTKNMAECAVKEGWRAVVMNQRGCSGAKITSERPLNFKDLDDFFELIHKIKAEFKPSKIFTVGFSLGAYLSANLSNVCEDVDGFVCISHTCNANEASKIICHPIQRILYLRVLIMFLRHIAHKSKGHVDSTLSDKFSTLEEFDDLYTVKYLNCHSHVEYYDQISVPGKCKGAKKPLLLIASTDDPFTDERLYPVSEVEESLNASMILVPEGGHVSFIEGMSGNVSYAERLSIEFFRSLL